MSAHACLLSIVTRHASAYEGRARFRDTFRDTLLFRDGCRSVLARPVADCSAPASAPVTPLVAVRKAVTVLLDSEPAPQFPSPGICSPQCIARLTTATQPLDQACSAAHGMAWHGGLLLIGGAGALWPTCDRRQREASEHPRGALVT